MCHVKWLSAVDEMIVDEINASHLFTMFFYNLHINFFLVFSNNFIECTFTLAIIFCAYWFHLILKPLYNDKVVVNFSRCTWFSVAWWHSLYLYRYTVVRCYFSFYSICKYVHCANEVDRIDQLYIFEIYKPGISYSVKLYGAVR